jgi:hypothetical protein
MSREQKSNKETKKEAADYDVEGKKAAKRSKKEAKHSLGR